MLFKSTINRETISNRDKLVEQLYIFLREFVPTKLPYENEQTVEDCIQETIMHMLDRFSTDGLDKVSGRNGKEPNYEKYFYNRAHSYTSYWLRRLKRERSKQREYFDTLVYYGHYKQDFIQPDYIDYEELESIVNGYNLGEIDTEILSALAETMLTDIGYHSLNKYSDTHDLTDREFLGLLADTTTDEYVLVVETKRRVK